MPLPPMPPRPDSPQCTKHGPRAVPRVAFSANSAGRLPNGLMLCQYCDMDNPSAGPPVLLEYLKRGHQ